MKRRILFPALVIFAMIPAIALLVPTFRSALHAPPNRPPHAEAEQESPDEGERWEWMRLHDPATGEIPRDIARREGAFALTLPAREGRGAKSGGASLAALDWSFRGPVNVGGRTRALAIDVTDTNILMAGGATGGMWRSTDAGASWNRTTLLWQHPGVTCIAQDRRPGKTGTWYYGTGEFRTNSTRFGNVMFPGDGIFKSTDRGLSWKQLPSTISATPQTLDQPFDFVSGIVVDSSNTAQDEIYAAAYGSIMRSTDGGTTWRATLGGLNNATGYSTVAITSTGVLYAGLGTGGATHGIFRSTDGINWSDITPKSWGDSCRRIVITVAPSRESVVYIAAETEGRGHAVNGSYGYPEYYSFWRYTYQEGDGSGGAGLWNDFSDNLPSEGGPWDYNGLDSYAMLVSVDPTNYNSVWLGGSNLYLSLSGFSFSTSQWMGGYGQDGDWGAPGTLHPDQHTMVFNPLNPNCIYVGNDGGIFRTYGADQIPPSWESLDNAYITSQFYTVAIDRETPGSQMVMGGVQDNGTYTTSTDDATIPWTWPFGGDGSFCAITNQGRDLYFSSQNGYILRQNLDDGSYSRIDPEGASGYLFIAPFTIDPGDGNIMYLAGGRTLWRNSDLSAIPAGDFSGPATVNWEELNNTTSSAQISAIGVSTALPMHRIYYGIADGKLYRLDNANDPGTPPQNITAPGFPAKAYINCVAVDPRDGNRALVVFTNYGVQSLFSTTDGGATWSAVGGNLEESPDGSGSGPSCRWGAITHYGGTDRIFVATSTGLYSTAELNGSSTVWELEGASTIGNVRVDMVQCRESDGMVAVATWGRGIFTSALPFSGVDARGGTTAGPSLDGPWPNPARDRATIRFTIPSGGARTSLTVFDPLGREVARPVDATLEGGPHLVTLDLASIAPGAMPNGSYFCRLESGGHTLTRSMIVER